MGRKLPLSLFAAPRTPTVDAVRRRLGGRASTERGAGAIVTVTTEGGGERAGVVLFVRGDDLHVWIAEGIVRRARRDAVRPTTSPELAALAVDAGVFGELAEGQSVRFQSESGELCEGTLIEKCRFGALILRPLGAVMGIGFRRIWPSAPPAADHP